MYRRDKNIPPHGRRAKADNVGNVRVRISSMSGIIRSVGDVFDIFLHIIPVSETYNAVVESLDIRTNKKISIPVDVLSEVLEQIVRLALNRDFMSIKNDEIFPDNVMLDGNVVSIQVRSDLGCLSIFSNMLEHTLLDGWIPTTKMNFHTPFHRLAALAFKALEIDPYEGVMMLVD